MTTLRTPSEDLYDAWLDCVRDYSERAWHGSGHWQIADFGPDRTSFDALLDIVRLESDPASALPNGTVHSDLYWVMDGDRMVGFMNVRHSIDHPFLRTEGGHIGYSIRSSARRQGHASRALRLALDRARELGLDRVLITCDEDNVASARTIEGAGGEFENVVNGKRRYWISLAFNPGQA